MAKPKVVFMEAEREVYDLMAAVIEERFPEIAGSEPPLKIVVLMATNGGEKHYPCLKHHGAACAAMIRKTKPEERADEAAPDVRILIDRNRWDERKERGRAAILAHELRHIAFKKDKNDEQKYDEYGRPVIGFVPDDWTLTGFFDVAEWYGTDAVEVECVRRVQETLVQLGLPFTDEEDRVVEAVERVVDSFITDADLRDGDAAVRKVAVMAAGEAGGGTSSVPAVSSVTLTKEHFEAAARAAKKLRGRASAAASPAV